MTGGTILPRLMVCFSIQPFTPQTTPECYQRMLEDLEGELLELGGRDPRPGGTWERHVIRAEFDWCSPYKLGLLARWWMERAATLAALAHLEAGLW